MTTASSLYKEQYLSKSGPQCEEEAKSCVSKFCLICDTQYCARNENGKNNWGDGIQFNLNSVTLFCSLFNLPHVDPIQKIPLCLICTVLLAKLVGYKEQGQGAPEELFKVLQEQLMARVIKTWRKYEMYYSRNRQPRTLSHTLRTSVYKKWSGAIKETSGQIIINLGCGNDPPKLDIEPTKTESRRKSRLLPRPGIAANTVPKLVCEGLRPPPKLIPRPPTFKAVIRHNPQIELGLNVPQTRKFDLWKGDQQSGDDCFREISIVEVKSISLSEQNGIDYIEVNEDDSSEEVSQASSNDEDPTSEAGVSDDYHDQTREISGASIKISQSIFEDNTDEICLSNVISLRRGSTGPDSESSEVSSEQCSESDKSSPRNEEVNEEIAEPTAITSPRRVGGRKRKPTLRVIESEELMTITKRRYINGSRSRSSSSSTPTSSREADMTDIPLRVDHLAIAELNCYDLDSKLPSINGQNYKCGFGSCDKIFKSRDRFKEHMLQHSGKSPRCHLCFKPFPRKYNLMQHLRTHTKEKPYACKICDRPYSDKSNLNSHLRKHVDKPNFCRVCIKMFRTVQETVKHIQLRHPDVNVNDAVDSSEH